MTSISAPRTRRHAVTMREHFRATLVLGLPLVGTNLAGFLVHLTDTLMLGWYDVTALAAATLATTFWFSLFILGAGFANAVMPMVAAADAEDDSMRVRRVTRMGLWLSVFFAALVIPILFWSEAMFIAIEQEPEIAALAQRYLRVAAFGLIPALAVMVLRSFLAALERTAFLLWITLLAIALNALINYALIFGNWGAPEMGIRGAAVASILVQSFWLVLIAGYVMRVLPDYELFRRWWKSDAEVMSQVFRLGVPIGLTGVAESGLFLASTVLMGVLGEVQLAAHGIVLQVAGLMFMFHLGMSQAATVRAAAAFGRKDETSLRRAGVAAIWASTVFGCLTVMIFLVFPEQISAIFIDPDDPLRDQVLAVSITLMALAALFQMVDAAQVMAIGLLRGVQDTAVPFYIAVFSYWAIGIPISYVLGIYTQLGFVGIWLGLVFGLTFAAILLMVRFWRRAVRIT